MTLEIANFPSSTAKSVAKWTWQNLTPGGFRDYVERTHTPEIQAKRGKVGGVRSGEVRRIGSASELKPWEAEGISRATWYRRKKNET